jgi:hypothetical protein
MIFCERIPENRVTPRVYVKIHVLLIAYFIFTLGIGLMLSSSGCQAPLNTPPANPPGANSPPADAARLIDLLKTLPTVRSAAPWQTPPYLSEQLRPGLIVEIRHYRIYTTLNDPLILRQIPIFLESAFESYAEMTASAVHPQDLLVVYLLKNRQQWEDITRQKTGALAPLYLKIKSGAYCFEGVCVAYHLGRQSDFSVLAHEGWHQFNNALFQDRLPAWLDEGLAACFEAWRWNNNRFSFVPRLNGARLIPLKNAISSVRLFTLADLLRLEPGQVVMGASNEPPPNDDTELQGAPGVYYAQVYALIRFLREENYGRRLMTLRKILDDALQGRWNLPQPWQDESRRKNIPLTRRWNMEVGPYIFEQYLGPPSGDIESEYLAFCRKITFHIKSAPLK